MPPAAIGPFKIEHELGHGGMGEVFLATDTRLDRRVAIKALPAHLAQDADRLARFQREAKVLASLNHPGIGAIYGLEEANGHQYLILEFIE
jgi:serine/threonine protein kinase